ncbi:MAG: hypothetical protein ACK55I_32100, partial [bacterium]
GWRAAGPGPARAPAGEHRRRDPSQRQGRHPGSGAPDALARGRCPGPRCPGGLGNRLRGGGNLIHPGVDGRCRC